MKEKSLKPHERVPVIILGHWFKFLDGFQCAAQDFYDQLKALMEARAIEGCEIGEVRLKEAGFFSQKRTYLRVTFAELTYDVCASAMGNSFFISAWLGSRPVNWFINLLLYVPYLNAWIVQKLLSKTYFQYDNLVVFKDVMHITLLGLIDEMTAEKGVEGPESTERIPIMRKLLRELPPEEDIWPDKWLVDESS